MPIKADINVPIPEVTEFDRIAAMRMHRLIEAGYTSDHAGRLSRCTYIDLHDAERLAEQVIAKGLPSSVAFEILI